MAERRMFAKTIIDSDAFLDMPLSTQALYFHLSMRADDEGFINKPKIIQRMIGATEDDLKILIAKSFVIPFESGIVVIKHWKIHNYIRADRLHPTKYIDEKSVLEVKENGAYTLSTDICLTDDSQMSGNLDTEVRLGKVSIGKVNKERRFSPPSVEEVAAYCKERQNGIDAEAFVAFYTSKGWKIGKDSMKDWKSAVITWEKRQQKDTPNNKNKSKHAALEAYYLGGCE